MQDIGNAALEQFVSLYWDGKGSWGPLTQARFFPSALDAITHRDTTPAARKYVSDLYCPTPKEFQMAFPPLRG